MIVILVFITAIALFIHTYICLTFFISSIREKEKRATLLGGLQLAIPLGLLGLLFLFSKSDFFDSQSGMATLCIGTIFVILAPLLLIIKTSPNNKALAGTKGFIVGTIRRFDERETVFFQKPWATARLGTI